MRPDREERRRPWLSEVEQDTIDASRGRKETQGRSRGCSSQLKSEKQHRHRQADEEDHPQDTYSHFCYQKQSEGTFARAVMVSFFSSSKDTAPQDDDRQPGPSKVSQPLQTSPTAASPPPATAPTAPALQSSSAIKSPLYAAMEDSALTVLTRTAAFTAGGGLLGSAVGIMRAEANVPPILLAVRGARSTFLFAGPFYGALSEKVEGPPQSGSLHYCYSAHVQL